MGAWGVGNFENDDAVDWACDIAGSKGVKVLTAPLRSIVSTSDYIEAPDCCQALVSAEIIAKNLYQDTLDLPEEIQGWLKQKKGLFGKPPIIEGEHASLAAEAVKKIISDSELKDLWQEAGEYEQWVSKQKHLLGALEKFNR